MKVQKRPEKVKVIDICPCPRLEGRLAERLENV